MAAAMLFNAVKPEIFGCDLQPDFSVNDEMSMCAGGNSGKEENHPTAGDLAKRINEQIGSAPITKIAKNIPFNIPVEDGIQNVIDRIT